MKRTSEVDDLKSDRQLLQKLLTEGDDVDELAGTRIHLIARSKSSQSIRLDQLRTQIESRIQKFPFPNPPERRRRTFFQWLESHGALEILLSESVLKEIRAALHLVAIAEADYQYEQNRRAGYGFPIKFHRGMLRELHRHQAQIEKLLRKHKVSEDWTSHYEIAIGRQEIKEILAVSSSKWSGDRKQIMGSGWKFELTSAIRVYAVLHKRLSTKLSDRCLQMLAPIIAWNGNGKCVSYGALRNALTRRKEFTQIPRKLSE